MNDCLICGVETKSPKRLCSSKCRRMHVNLTVVKSLGISSGSDDKKEILFEGEALCIWKDSDRVVFSFYRMGTELSFFDEDDIEAVLDDILMLAHSITCENDD